MFELADYLVGIYKVDDCTQSLAIQNYDKQRVLGIGEKEGEKENQTENAITTSPSLKENGDLSIDVSMSSPPPSQQLVWFHLVQMFS